MKKENIIYSSNNVATAWGIGIEVIKSQSSGWQAKINQFSEIEDESLYRCNLTIHSSIPLEVVDDKPVYTIYDEDGILSIESGSSIIKITHEENSDEYYILQKRPTSRTEWRIVFERDQSHSWSDLREMMIEKMVYKDPEGSIPSYKKVITRVYEEDKLTIYQDQFQKF